MESYIVKEKRPPHYIKCGTCLNCGSKIVREGERREIENLLKIDCPVCGDHWSVPMGFMHNLNSKFAKKRIQEEKMNKIEKLMAEAILFAIDNLGKDMQINTDINEVREEAVAIKRLAEAYDIIKKGKGRSGEE